MSISLDDIKQGVDGSHLHLAHENAMFDASQGELSSDDVSLISSFLADNPQITSLCVASRSIDDDAIKGLATIDSISSLDVSDCIISSEGNTLIANNINLIKLNLGWHETLSDETISALSQHPNLVELNVGHTNLSIEKLSKLVENKNLTSINLSANRLGIEGINVIAKALEAGNKWNSLNLMGNNIGNEGLGLLVTALEGNRKLISLDVCNNGIDSNGLKAVATNKSLKSLNLDANKITNEGVKDLTENKFLTSLSVNGNKIDNDGLSAIQAMLERNKSSGILVKENVNRYTLFGDRTIPEKLHESVNKKVATDDSSKNTGLDDAPGANPFGHN